MAVVSEPTPLDIIGGAVSAAASAIAAALPGSPVIAEAIDGIVPLPAGAVAVAGGIGGAAAGGLAVAVTAELAEALANGPVPVQDIHAALAPALADAVGALEPTFGTPLHLEAPQTIPAELALGSLRGAVVSVPILAGGVHVATFAVSVDIVDDEVDDPNAGGAELGLPDLDRTPSRRLSPVTDPGAFDLLGDVEMGITAELGRTRMTVRDLLALTPGTVVELDRAAGSPVDLLVNGTLIARGEVVVVDDEFGVRISEIVSRDGHAGRRR